MNNYDLTLEQQFELKRMQDAAQAMTKEQAIELLIQAKRLLMIKTNVLKNLIENEAKQCSKNL